MDNYRLLQGDCVTQSKLIDDNTVDLFLLDLPYGRTAAVWDTMIDPPSLWEIVDRIGKENAVTVMFGIRPFSSIMVMSKRDWYRFDMIWKKNVASGHLNANRQPLRNHEDILVFSKHPPRYNPQMSTGHPPMNAAINRKGSSVYGKFTPKPNNAGTTKRYPKTVIPFAGVKNNSSERVHPSQKPIPLLRYLIRTFSNAGQVVCDLTMGSGSTGMAAILEKRPFIGIEGDSFELAEKRIRWQSKQPVQMEMEFTGD